MSVKMVCARHYTLRTTSGHVIRFEPNKPIDVPDSVVSEAMAVNILPVEGQELTQGASDAVVKHVSITGVLRDTLALRAMEEMARDNDPEDFDAGGRPKVNNVNQRAGLSLSASERNTYWDKYRAMKSNGEDLPNHKAAATVMEIQYLSTPKDMREYAQALGVEDEAFLGHSMHAQKQLLLAAAVKGA